MSGFEILAGLPPYGPVALQFPVGDLRAHREGFVVRFRPKAGEAWVGNFQPGSTWFSTVLAHPDERSVMAIASGAGYVVDPDARKLTSQGGADAILSSGEITWAELLPSSGILLLWDGFRLAGLKAVGKGWVSSIITHDGGVRSVAVDGAQLHLEVTSADDFDGWRPVELDRDTGGMRNPKLY